MQNNHRQLFIHPLGEGDRRHKPRKSNKFRGLPMVQLGSLFLVPANNRAFSLPTIVRGCFTDFPVSCPAPHYSNINEVLESG